MEEVKYTIAGDPRIRTAPATLVGTRAWKLQGCQLVPEAKPVMVTPPAPAAKKVTPKAQPDANKA
jgi:hypothetical protein